MTKRDSARGRENKRPTKSVRRPRRRPGPIIIARSPDDPLEAQEELAIELYFRFGFDRRRAWLEAGYGSARSSTNAYRFFKQAHIQAAILRRRAELRDKARLTREEALVILEGRIREPRIENCDLARLVALWAKMTGHLDRIPEPESRGEEITPAALRAAGADEIIRRINGRLAIAATRARVIDATAEIVRGEKP